MNTSINFILQGKGGVGKSFATSILNILLMKNNLKMLLLRIQTR